MTNSKRQFLLAVMLGGLSALTVACQTLGTREKTDPLWYCQAFRPITWVASDSAETLNQINEHNAVWDALCNSMKMPDNLQNSQ